MGYKYIWDIKSEFNKESEILKKTKAEVKMEKNSTVCEKIQWKAIPTCSSHRLSGQENMVDYCPLKKIIK